MLYPSINKIRKKADSRYTLVILAAKRARDIIDGKPALTENSVNRPVSIAAHEIAEDLITYSREGEARPVEEEDSLVEMIEPEVLTEAEESPAESDAGTVDEAAASSEESEEGTIPLAE